ncbi:MAG TPA: DnaA regulatory inactivator Hda [Steroidobacteraceae bacterium]|nr:DnaA regulatory inactivator Hda [Steroidobacteraceae bacterium]
MQQLPLAVRLRDRAVFGSFLAGPNAHTVAQLRNIVAGPRTVCWLYGPRGSGKTHLLQAVCAQVPEHAEAVYLPLAQLAGLDPEVLQGLQRVSCLCLDDLAAVLGRLPWELALFNLYRDAEERGASLIVAEESLPQRLNFALPDLASRLRAAVLLPLLSLDEAAQREALRLRAQLRGLELPEETALYLQRRFRRDMPTLYGLLDALDEAALLAQRRLTVPFIRDVLARQPT